MQLSRNISSTEPNVSCDCGCGLNKVSSTLIQVLQDVRDYFGKPLHFNSCCRCESHNKKVDGSENSYHLPDINGVCNGADIRLDDIESDDVADYLERKYPNCFGIGRYVGRIHIDVRAYRARWDKR